MSKDSTKIPRFFLVSMTILSVVVRKMSPLPSQNIKKKV